MRIVHKPLGRLLVERKIISEHQLNKALKIQEKEGGLLGQILLRLGYVTEEDIVICLATQFGYPYLPLGNCEIEPEIVQLIPKEIAYQYYAIPIDKVDKILTVAMVDPSNKSAIEDIEYATKCRVQAFVSTSTDIKKAIERYYGPLEEKFQKREPSELSFAKAKREREKKEEGS
ncbi:MAG: hypothetical protein DRP75_02745 [Candidatus Omnitrophota bacterium]|nr:MAG: hypothetical protein DRP75_02745 [Candidatus Omnitrophota bacterium]